MNGGERGAASVHGMRAYCPLQCVCACALQKFCQPDPFFVPRNQDYLNRRAPAQLARLSDKDRQALVAFNQQQQTNLQALAQRSPDEQRQLVGLAALSQLTDDQSQALANLRSDQQQQLADAASLSQLGQLFPLQQQALVDAVALSQLAQQLSTDEQKALVDYAAAQQAKDLEGLGEIPVEGYDPTQLVQLSDEPPPPDHTKDWCGPDLSPAIAAVRYLGLTLRVLVDDMMSVTVAAELTKWSAISNIYMQILATCNRYSMSNPVCLALATSYYAGLQSFIGALAFVDGQSRCGR